MALGIEIKKTESGNSHRKASCDLVIDNHSIDNALFSLSDFNGDGKLDVIFGNPNGTVNGYPVRDTRGQHAMVCSFITSQEYQERFSTVSTHSNQECGQ